MRYSAAITSARCAIAIIGCAFASLSRAEPAMWMIKSDDSTIYLLGTLHILRSETQWESEKISRALNEASELWVEVVVHNETDATDLLHQYGFDSQHPLSTRLNEGEREQLASVAAQYGFPMSLLEQMKPWYAAVNFDLLPLLKAGYNPNAGVDEVLEIQARAQGHKVAGLETLADQFRLLSNLSMQDQISLLRETLTDAEQGVELLEQSSKEWLDGDVDPLTVKFIDEMKRDAPELYQTLIVERNARWSRQIAVLLQHPGVRFIAVGAAHLLGPDSVQAQLQKLGINSVRY